MSELKPCPFCGNKPRIKNGTNSEDNPYSQVVHDCPNLWNTMETFCYATETAAIERWNRRVPDIDIPTDRMQEICEAEAEGRLVVLPCKVGEHVWVIAAYGDFFNTPVKGTVSQFVWHKPIKDDIEAIIYMTDGKYADSRLGYFVQSSFGKLVFLAKEAAEAALLKGDE